MTTPEFIIASVSSHRDELIQLNVEYVDWGLSQIEDYFGVPAGEIVGMSASEYVPTVIDKICGAPPPKGIFYLVKVDGQLSGMGGLRFLQPNVAEVKRIYIRTEFRGLKLGKIMLERLLADARSFGYQKVCLDTGPFMKAAHRLYEQNGFRDRPAYEGVEVPVEFHHKWRFMERAL